MNLFSLGFEEFPLRSRRSLALFLSPVVLVWLVGSAEESLRRAVALSPEKPFRLVDDRQQLFALGSAGGGSAATFRLLLRVWADPKVVTISWAGEETPD